MVEEWRQRGDGSEVERDTELQEGLLRYKEEDVNYSKLYVNW